eukprot:5541957-Prymnesium_polylepis.1
MQRAMQRSMGHPTRGLFRVELTQPTDVCHANHGGRGVCVTSHVAQGSVLSSVRQLSDVGEATTANLWSPTKQEVLKLLSDGSLEPSLRCNVLHWIYVEADSGQLRLLLDSPILVNHEVTSLTTLATDGAPALDAATGAASPHPRWRAARDLVPGDELTENYCGGKFGQDPEFPALTSSVSDRPLSSYRAALSISSVPSGGAISNLWHSTVDAVLRWAVWTAELREWPVYGADHSAVSA